MNRQLSAVLVLALVGLTHATSAAGQGDSYAARQPTRVAALIALAADRVPSGADYQILRRSDVEPHDVILFAPGAANAERLAAAIDELLIDRSIRGDTVGTGGLVRVKRTGPHRPLPWTARVAADLKQAPLVDIPGVGRYPALAIWLPPQHRRP